MADALGYDVSNCGGVESASVATSSLTADDCRFGDASSS